MAIQVDSCRANSYCSNRNVFMKVPPESVHTNANCTDFKEKLDPNQCNYCLLFTHHLPRKDRILCLAAGEAYLQYFFFPPFQIVSFEKGYLKIKSDRDNTYYEKAASRSTENINSSLVYQKSCKRQETTLIIGTPILFVRTKQISTSILPFSVYKLSIQSPNEPTR